MPEEEVVREHPQLDGHELDQTSGDSEGHGTWHAVSVGSQKVGHGLSTEQQHPRECPDASFWFSHPISPPDEPLYSH